MSASLNLQSRYFPHLTLALTLNLKSTVLWFDAGSTAGLLDLNCDLVTHFLTGASFLISLCYSFFICKMENKTVPL